VEKFVQLRHLQYFVAVAEASSFSGAAKKIHVAQSALSLQIAELEDAIGTVLLHRSVRGVQPTEAGKALLTEATLILRHLEKLPAIVRSTAGEIEGNVRLGMSSTLAGFLTGPLIDACRLALPQVNLQFYSGDSVSLSSRVDAGALDLAAIFEGASSATFKRNELFAQRLFLISRSPLDGRTGSIAQRELAALPLILPARPNSVRKIIDRVFEELNATPNIVTETDVFWSMVGAVQSGLGHAILPKGDFADVPGHATIAALVIEPPLYLTASIISRADAMPSAAVDAVRTVVMRFFTEYVRSKAAPGMEWSS
jgi:LysR family nitrogen assimilation transcriptional regulator